MSELHAALGSRRRVRATRIAAEAYDHLEEASADLEARGMSRADAEHAAVARMGPAADYAAGFRTATPTDWLIDTVRWVVPLVGVLLLAIGAALTLVDATGWIVGADPVAAARVRVWRTCTHAIRGECVGDWRESTAPTLLVAGIIFVLAGIGVTAVSLVLGRRYSDRELVPRWLRRAAFGLFGLLGAVLIIGGSTRSLLDASWRWVPLWAATGVACVTAALLGHRRIGREPSPTS
jgi:hypothetical protein